MQTVGSMCRGCAWVRGIGWLGSDAPEFLNRGLFAKGWQDDVKCRVLGLHRDPCHQLVPYRACGVLLCMEGWLILSLGGLSSCSGSPGKLLWGSGFFPGCGIWGIFSPGFGSFSPEGLCVGVGVAGGATVCIEWRRGNLELAAENWGPSQRGMQEGIRQLTGLPLWAQGMGSTGLEACVVPSGVSYGALIRRTRLKTTRWL